MSATLGADLLGGQSLHATPGRHAAEHLLPTSQSRCEAHIRTAGGQLLDRSHTPHDTRGLAAAVDPPSSTPTTEEPAMPNPDASGWMELRVCADLFWRAQEERKATANLLRHHDADYWTEHLARLEATEHAAKLLLRRCYRRVVPASLREWQKASRGIGEDSIARVLGHLGDPYIAAPHWWEGTGTNRVLMVGEPYVRTVSQLWQYAGHGAPSRKAKGMTAEELFALGNPGLKMLVHLQAEWCMKAGGHYREVYDVARLTAADKLHGSECVRCGPSGKPAQVGTPWTAGHQHAHALRIVGKEILRDMWLVRHAEEQA